MLRCLQVYRGVQWTNYAGCRTFDVRPLQVEGSPLVQRRFVHSFWTISGTDAQKRHSCGLGTRLAGLSADSLRINAPRFCTNWSSTASAGMRTVWSR